MASRAGISGRRRRRLSTGSYAWHVLSLCWWRVVVVFSTLKPQFFPKDLQYFSYIDVWLPEDAPVSATSEVTRQVESIVRRVADDYGKCHPEHGHPKEVLLSMTSFLGGGGPRFWTQRHARGQTNQLRASASANERPSRHDSAAGALAAGV